MAELVKLNQSELNPRQGLWALAEGVSFGLESFGEIDKMLCVNRMRAAWISVSRTIFNLHETLYDFNNGRARHSVRAALVLFLGGAHGVMRPRLAF